MSLQTIPANPLFKVKAPVRTVLADGGGTVRIEVEAPEIARTARPGQFLMIRCGSGQYPLLRRPVSIAYVSGQRIGLLVKPVGIGTKWICKRNNGDSLDLLGPLGKGFEYQSAGSCILVAGGIGAPPLLFLARTLTGRSVKTTVLLGARTSPDIVLEPMFRDTCDDVRIVTDDGSLGRRGLVTDLLFEVLGESRAGARSVFACGPPLMLKNTALACTREGVTCQLSLETRMGCGFGACMGCAVPAKGGGYLQACTDGPVFDSRDIDLEKLA